MPVFLLPQFIVDLQTCDDTNFARRILQKTIQRNGDFKEDSDDHRYSGVADAWIRYVSRGTSAYRVIFIRSGSNVYLYRAGRHAIEERVDAPRDSAFDAAIPLVDPEATVANTIAAISPNPTEVPPEPTTDRLLSNTPCPAINQAIFARRNLPHRDIWLVVPLVAPELLIPTAKFGKMLFEQAEDGANIMLITAPPKDRNIEWLEQLEERNVSVYVYPRLCSKLYCFVLDENRKYEHGLPHPDKLSSLLLVGSTNVTVPSLALSEDRDEWNEEICYAMPDSEVGYVETYITKLISRGYSLSDVRAFFARGQWNRLEETRWC